MSTWEYMRKTKPVTLLKFERNDSFGDLTLWSSTNWELDGIILDRVSRSGETFLVVSSTTETADLGVWLLIVRCKTGIIGWTWFRDLDTDDRIRVVQTPGDNLR